MDRLRTCAHRLGLWGLSTLSEDANWRFGSLPGDRGVFVYYRPDRIGGRWAEVDHSIAWLILATRTIITDRAGRCRACDERAELYAKSASLLLPMPPRGHAATKAMKASDMSDPLFPPMFPPLFETGTFAADSALAKSDSHILVLETEPCRECSVDGGPTMRELGTISREIWAGRRPEWLHVEADRLQTEGDPRGEWLAAWQAGVDLDGFINKMADWCEGNL